MDVCSTLITELNLLHNTNLESLMCDDDIDYRYKTKRFKGSLSLKIILSKEGFEKISFNKHRGTGRAVSNIRKIETTTRKRCSYYTKYFFKI